MENFPQPQNNQDSKLETESRYNFPEIMESLKPAMISLVSKMKERIDSGYYDTIISDEVAGRIPTLILRKILQKRKHNKELKTYFLALGRSIKYWDDDLHKWAEEKGDNLGHTLFVTQYIRQGTSLYTLLEALNKSCDIAAAYVNTKGIVSDGTFASKQNREVFKYIPRDGGIINYSFDKNKGFKEEEESSSKLYIGIAGFPEYSVNEGMVPLAGVDKRKIPSLEFDEYRGKWIDYIKGIYPEKLERLSSDPEASLEQYKEHVLRYYGSIGSGTPEKKRRDLIEKIRNEKKEHSHNNWSNEKERGDKKQEIQDTVNKARQDVSILADEVMAEVWG